MIRNILKGFIEPKAEPLFSIEIELDPYSENVLQEGHQDVTVRLGLHLAVRQAQKHEANRF